MKKNLSFSGPVEILLSGDLIILNTFEDFKAFDAKKALKDLLLKNIDENTEKNEKFELNEKFEKNEIFAKKLVFEKLFVLVVFADLKSHVFHYFLLFPSIKLSEEVKTLEFCPLKEKFLEKVHFFLFFLQEFLYKDVETGGRTPQLSQ